MLVRFVKIFKIAIFLEASHKKYLINKKKNCRLSKAKEKFESVELPDLSATSFRLPAVLSVKSYGKQESMALLLLPLLLILLTQLALSVLLMLWYLGERSQENKYYKKY